MEPDPYIQAMLNLSIVLSIIDVKVIIGFLIIVLMLVASALISGSEVAFFSLTPGNLKEIAENKSRKAKIAYDLLNRPKYLLATILISNNFVNVGIVILSSFITSVIFDFSNSPILGFIIQVIVVTFLLLFFGEILPKVYAHKFALKFVLLMAYPILILQKLFSPFSRVLVNMTSVVDKRITKRKINLSLNDISYALDLTESKELKEDEKILKGIVKFGNIDVNEIMKPRVDVVSVDINTHFNKLVSVIVESGYSRIPVFQGSFDTIKGVLYVKDLLPHLHKNENFRWQSLVRPPYYVPETKKINDLLEEFQTRKIHMAIVIDEYGGSSGIVTLEDIIEEIVGEITDEFDTEGEKFVKVDEQNYIFEGKILLNDFYKVLSLEEDYFDLVKGDADTLAGLILELKGEIPQKHETIKYKKFEFKIKSADDRRIKQIMLKIK